MKSRRGEPNVAAVASVRSAIEAGALAGGKEPRESPRPRETACADDAGWRATTRERRWG